MTSNLFVDDGGFRDIDSKEKSHQTACDSDIAKLTLVTQNPFSITEIINATLHLSITYEQKTAKIPIEASSLFNPYVF